MHGVGVVVVVGFGYQPGQTEKHFWSLRHFSSIYVVHTSSFFFLLSSFFFFFFLHFLSFPLDSLHLVKTKNEVISLSIKAFFSNTQK